MRNNRLSLTFLLFPIVCLAMMSLDAANTHAEELITYHEYFSSAIDGFINHDYYSTVHSLGENNDYASIFDPALDYAKELHEDYEGVAGGYNGIAYTLMDLNGDGVKELLIRQMDGREGSHLWTFGIHRGTAYYLDDIWIEGFMPDKLAGYGNGVICITDLDGHYSLCCSEDNEMKNLVDLLLEPGENIPGFDNLSDYYSIDRITDECPGFYDLSDMTLMDQETAIINEKMQKYEAGLNDDDLLAIYKDYAEALSKWCDYLDQDNAAIAADGYSTVFDNILYSGYVYLSGFRDNKPMFSLNDFNNDGIPEMILAIKVPYEWDMEDEIILLDILSWSPKFTKVRSVTPAYYYFAYYILGDDTFVVESGKGNKTVELMTYDGESFSVDDYFYQYWDDMDEDPGRSWHRLIEWSDSKDPTISVSELNQTIESHGVKAYTIFPVTDENLAALAAGDIAAFSQGVEKEAVLPHYETYY